MNFQQLAAYIRELQQSGFDTIALQVQFYRKFAVPLFAAIMALISVPFSFAVGKSRRDGRRGNQLRDRDRVRRGRQSFRTGGRRQPAARGDGGMVAGRGVYAGGSVLFFKNANLNNQRAD